LGVVGDADGGDVALHGDPFVVFGVVGGHLRLLLN
jgi:hypothetical protein